MSCRVLLIVCSLLLAVGVHAVSAEGVAVDTVADVAADTAVAAGSADVADVDGDSVVGEPSPRRGLDIGALLAEDNEDDLLVEREPIVEPTVADALLAEQVDGVERLAGDEGGDDAADAASVVDTEYVSDVERAADAGETVSPEPAVMRGGRGPPRSSAAAVEPELGPVVVTDGRTINFAQNLSEYRSPRVAMLLSLLVPGLGQAYSRSYAKAVAFMSVEVAGIGVAAYFGSVGRSKKRDAHRFADANFCVEQLRAYDARLRQEFAAREILIDDMIYPRYDSTFFNAAMRGQSYFYESIRDRHFTPGWMDNAPDIEDILAAGPDTIVTSGGRFVLFEPEAPHLFYMITRVVDRRPGSFGDNWMLGYSSDQARYNRLINDANSYHDAVNYTLYVILLNHIASAIDAGFTARAFNARLLGRESVWERVSIEQQYVFTGSEVSPGLAFRVRF
jgi:hypothetical protein